jgi:Flp pilus assembly protein TadG
MSTGIRRHERGLTSTEVAVLMPILIALVLVPIQVGLWWHAKQVADGAAREAVDAAQVISATEADGGQLTVSSTSPGTSNNHM